MPRNKPIRELGFPCTGKESCKQNHTVRNATSCMAPALPMTEGRSRHSACAALLRSQGWKDYARITVRLNPHEEIGSLGSGETIARLGAEHDVVLSLEPTAAKAVTLLNTGPRRPCREPKGGW